MQYEETPVTTKLSGTAKKKIKGATLDQFSTVAMLWHLVKRHKVAILAVGNIVLVLNWAFPEWGQMALSLIGK